MARKSKKHLLDGNQEPIMGNPQADAGYKVALYVRISVDSDEKRDRGTIDNQMMLLEQFVNEHLDMSIYDRYYDNDVSGTGFERAAFQRMMEDVRQKKVNCIIVKDLSRLGRNYVETGNYIERVFPFFDVRFIAINDGYDSLTTESGMMMPLKNIVNELYAKDISRRICKAREVSRQRGDYAVGSIPYGYERSQINRHRLVVSEEAAVIVKRIFDLRLAGLGYATIANRMMKEKVLIPTKYKQHKKGNFSDEGDCGIWRAVIIRQILSNQIYVGDTVQGKRKSALYLGKKQYKTSKEEWTIVQNTHEAIVSREDFEKVQRMNEQTRSQHLSHLEKYSGSVKMHNLFCKKMICADCGKTLGFKKARKRYRYFCRTQEVDHACKTKIVYKEVLDEAVFQAIKVHMNLYLETKKVQDNYKKSRDHQRNTIHFETELVKLNQQLQKLVTRKTQLYEDFVEGLLNEDEYLLASKQYSEKTNDCKAKIEELQKYQKKYREESVDELEFKNLIEKYRNKRKLTQDMVDSFIEKIVVNSQNEIEIVFRFRDIFEEIVPDQRGGEA